MKKDSIVSKGLRFLITFISFGAFGFFAGKAAVGASSQMSGSAITTILLLFIPIFFIVIAVHEAGHAIAGVWMDFDFKTYVVGPLMWEKEKQKWRFRWNRNVNTAGGLVICIPMGTQDLKKRFSVYAAGGPLASLLLALIAFGMFYAISPSTIFLEVASGSLCIMAFLSIVIFIATALPMRAGGFSSDGARVLRLMQGGDISRFELLILLLITNASAGVRPREINTDELREASVLAKKLQAPFGVYLHSFSHQAEFDKGNMDEAEKHLLEYISNVESIPKGIRNIVWLDAAFFYAYAKRNIDEAEKYWTKFQPAALIPKAQIFATEAAIAVLKNDNPTALTKISEAEKEIPNMIDNGLGLALKDKLSILRDLATGRN
ncbi:MAG: hypothetical protein CFE23_07920 [Flavobacterium sp. BFFFF1]|uniref:site-2 protease family protein n=1 Tax=unclassified Flavobacterium TaxID=196869 RepID=UPI000BDC6A32|nr:MULTISPECIES: site-2 protease family protein [unclassified Flavobacterium]OYU80643.1 MAG: hypothetical protein CFE23_07920 [Flavobacterium sp. BFFFF1]